MEYKFIKTDYLEMVAGGDNELLKELVNMFRDQVDEFNGDFRKHFVERNFEALGLLAHKAKSSVAIMGMDNLANLLKKFEIQAKEGKEADLFESYILQFESDTKSAIAELDSVINNK